MNLFIGGPADGRRIDVPDHYKDLWLAERPPFRMVMPPGSDKDSTLNEVKRHRYVKERFSTLGKDWFFYRWEGLSLEEAVTKLFDCYQRDVE